MTREEIQAIVDATLQVNLKLADKFMQTAFAFGESQRNQAAQQLAFTVPAAEVRTMLRKRADSVRSELAVRESAIPEQLEAFDQHQHPLPPDGPPYMRPPTHEAFEASLRADLVSGREFANRLDWFAAHLAEQAYSLSTHEVSDLLFPVCNDASTIVGGRHSYRYTG